MMPAAESVTAMMMITEKTVSTRRGGRGQPHPLVSPGELRSSRATAHQELQLDGQPLPWARVAVWAVGEAEVARARLACASLGEVGVWLAWWQVDTHALCALVTHKWVGGWGGTEGRWRELHGPF